MNYSKSKCHLILYRHLRNLFVEISYLYLLTAPHNNLKTMKMIKSSFFYFQIRKYLTILLCCLLSLNFTSCFSLVEELTLTKDGSGTFVATIDISEMMSLFSTILPDTLKEQLSFVESIEKNLIAYEKIEGISEVKADSPEEYVYQISYHFANVNALNNVLNLNDSSMLFPQQKIINTERQIEFKRNKLFRNLQLPPLKEEESLINAMDIDTKTQEQFFRDLKRPTYTFVYTLPKKVKKANVTDSIGIAIKDDKQAIFTYELFDFISGKELNINHQIKFGFF